MNKLKYFIIAINLEDLLPETIMRLIATVISILFFILQTLDIPIPVVDDNTVMTLALTLFGVIAFLQSYWKNNSWTKAAQDADKMMHEKQEGNKLWQE